MDAAAGELAPFRQDALSVSVFGAPRLQSSNGGEIFLSNRRARSLLAMLCIAPDNRMERELASKLLWPGRFSAQARASLRQCLLNLDKALAGTAGPVLKTSREQIALVPGAVRSDLSDLQDALRSCDLATAISLLETIGNQRLLEGIDFGEPFLRWLEGRRVRIERRLHREVAIAQDALERSEDQVAKERLAKTWRACGRAIAPRDDDRPRIAVLPFEQFNATGRELYLAEGVTEELTSRLGKVKELAVIGRTSVAGVAAGGGTLQTIAKALGATHLIEGSAHLFSQGIRIVVRLTDGATGTETWSHRWDGSVEEVIDARQGIGSEVVAGICGALDLPYVSSPARPMTTNREAYALYLQGRSMFLRVVGGSIPKGVELLEKALHIEPDFAECWAALAEAMYHVAAFSPSTQRRQLGERMAECARRALAIDPHHAYAMVMLGLYEFVNGNPCRGLELGYEAHRIDPDHQDVLIRLGCMLLYLGKAKEALPYIQYGIERDPLYGRTYQALLAAHHQLGNLDQAEEAGRRTVELNHWGALLGSILAAKGKHEEARAIHYDSRILMNPMFLPPSGTEVLGDEDRDRYWSIAADGVCSGDPGKREAYCHLLDELHETMLDPYDLQLAYPAVWMGHAALVIKIYREGMTLNNVSSLLQLWVANEPTCRIWQHPDFLDMAKHVGFVEAWEKYGWPDLLPRPEKFSRQDN